MMKYVYLFAAGISVALIVLGGRTLYLTGYEKGKLENSVQVITETDTVFTERLIYKDRIRTRTEVETLFVENSIPVVEYVAVQDTSISDSTYDLRVQYRSDLPLSKDGYFRVWLNTRFPEIRETKTVTQIVPEKSSRFGLGITFSGGYGFYRQKPDVLIGLGLYYKIDF